MLFADCVPILFYDPRKEVIAAAHAGWRGTFKKVAAEAIMAMKNEFGCEPRDIIAGIGPSICADHYQVGEKVFDGSYVVLVWGCLQENFYSSVFWALGVWVDYDAVEAHCEAESLSAEPVFYFVGFYMLSHVAVCALFLFNWG